MCAGTPPPSAHSAGGEMTLPPTPASGQPPAAQRPCVGAEGSWLWEKGAVSASAPTSHHAPSCSQLRADHVHSSSLPHRACSASVPRCQPQLRSPLPSPSTAPHRTDPSLQAAARNFQGARSCSELVPGTTERDMYLQQTRDAHQRLSDTCGPREAGGPAEQPEASTGFSSEHSEEAEGKTEPFPNPRSPLRPSCWAQDTRNVRLKPSRLLLPRLSLQPRRMGIPVETSTVPSALPDRGHC